MSETFHEPEELSNSQLRELYKNLCAGSGKDSHRVHKMGRDELLKAVKRLLSEKGMETDAPDGYWVPQKQAEEYAVKPTTSDKTEECFSALLEALRMYVKYYLFSQFGNKSEQHAKVCLSSARKLCEEACGMAVDVAGNGWDKANRVFNVVDRALLKLRNDFCDTLVSSCVMTSLLSDKHQAELATARRGKF